MYKHKNATTNCAYQGKNQSALMGAMQEGGFKSYYWVTFLQAKSLELKVKKGSHGVSIFKGFNKVDVKDKDGKVKTESRPSGYAKVFNLDQTEKYIKEKQ